MARQSWEAANETGPHGKPAPLREQITSVYFWLAVLAGGAATWILGNGSQGWGDGLAAALYLGALLAWARARRRFWWRHRSLTPGEKRERYTVYWRIGLSVVGLAVAALVVLGLVFPRTGGDSRAELKECIASWNASTNGPARSAFGTSYVPSGRTLRPRIWLGPVDGRCSLAYLRLDGSGYLWRQIGRSFFKQAAPLTVNTYPSSVSAAEEPNVKLASSDPARGLLVAR
jgi:hypothetical protein